MLPFKLAPPHPAAGAALFDARLSELLNTYAPDTINVVLELVRQAPPDRPFNLFDLNWTERTFGGVGSLEARIPLGRVDDFVAGETERCGGDGFVTSSVRLAKDAVPDSDWRCCTFGCPCGKPAKKEEQARRTRSSLSLSRSLTRRPAGPTAGRRFGAARPERGALQEGRLPCALHGDAGRGRRLRDGGVPRLGARARLPRAGASHAERGRAGGGGGAAAG